MPTVPSRTAGIKSSPLPMLVKVWARVVDEEKGGGLGGRICKGVENTCFDVKWREAAACGSRAQRHVRGF